MDYEFEVITPLMWIDKKETWALADRLGVFDIIRNETLTCYAKDKEREQLPDRLKEEQVWKTFCRPEV